MPDAEHKENNNLSAHRKKIITEEILPLLKKGTAPWQKPWDINNNNRFMIPINGVSGKRYRGGNVIHLQAVAINNNYHDPRWYTFNQVKKIPRAYVRRGSKGTRIFFYQPKTKVYQKPSGEKVKLDVGEVSMFVVFNAEQIKGLGKFNYNSYLNFDPNERAENIVKLNNADVLYHDVDKAFYVPSKDKIYLPPKTAFPTEEKYYATLLHEVSHSTGHESRLNRDLSGKFGSENYAREELVAEIASMLLCHDLGIRGCKDIENHTAYIKSWISMFEKDTNELFKAATKAEQVCTYLFDLEKKQDNTQQNVPDVPKVIQPQVKSVSTKQDSIVKQPPMTFWDKVVDFIKFCFNVK